MGAGEGREIWYTSAGLPASLSQIIMLAAIRQYYSGIAWGLTPEEGPVVVLQAPSAAAPQIYSYYAPLDEIMLDLAQKKGFAVAQYQDEHYLERVRADTNALIIKSATLPPAAKEYLLALKDWPEFCAETEIIWEAYRQELNDVLRYNLARGSQLYTAQTTGRDSFGLLPILSRQNTVDWAREKFFSSPAQLLNYLLGVGCQNYGILIHDTEVTKFLRGEDKGQLKTPPVPALRAALCCQVGRLVRAEPTVFPTARSALSPAPVLQAS